MGQGRSRAWAYGLLLPAVIAVGWLVAYPLYLVVNMSLRLGRTLNFARIGEMPVGLGNYERVLSDPNFWHSLLVTAIYVSCSMVPAFAIGLVIAVLLNRPFPGRRWLRSLLILPWAVPGVIVTINFLWLFEPTYGIINSWLREAGLIDKDIPWFASSNTALFAVIMPTIWKAYPFFTLTILAALQSIPDSLYEAARVDGAVPLQTFRYITWPGIRNAALLAGILNSLWAYREFDIIYASTAGGPARATETLGILVYNEAFTNFRMGTASAMGILMVLLASCVMLAFLRTLRRAYF